MSSTLPKNLSPWNMFMEADWLVKGVIISLAFASLLSWTVLLSKSFELALLKRALLKARITLTGSHSLADAANSGSTSSVGRGLIIAAVTELQLSSDILNKKESSISVINDGVKERVASSLSRMEAALTRRMMFGTGLLATIGAIAPFVGLFGTVWGIMNSFISISESQTTNLAVVAPGIAEALLATALGLVAAIPAVVIYNYFTRKILGLKAMVSDISAGVMRLVSRDLDRGMTLNIVTPTIPSARVAE
jgi:biopolymer transport protein ExbB